MADLANGGVLDEDGEARLYELQAILNGEFSEGQKTHSGCITLVNGSGEIEIAAGLVRPEDKKATIDSGLLQAPQVPKSDAPKSPYSQKLVADISSWQSTAPPAGSLSASTLRRLPPTRAASCATWSVPRR